MKKLTIALHLVLIVLELAALFHDFSAFGFAMFKYYTIDSNLLQLLVSILLVYFLVRARDDIPYGLTVTHLICAVCLTITFFIALLVLAPQEGFAYYFLQDVAPINHAIGPFLSLVTFVGFAGGTPLRKSALLFPMAASLLYGLIALLLNALGLLDGPYFFLRIREVPISTVVTWFGIICVLCLVLSALFVFLRGRLGKLRRIE